MANLQEASLLAEKLRIKIAHFVSEVSFSGKRGELLTADRKSYLEDMAIEAEVALARVQFELAGLQVKKRAHYE